jgi:PGF-CTERM protein
VTDETGVGIESVTVSRGIEPYNAVTWATRYETMENPYFVNVYDLPGSVTLDAPNETSWGDPVAAPGETVTVDFTTPDGTSASGLAFAEFEHNASYAEGSVATSVTTTTNGTLTVPAYAANDSYVGIDVWAADSSGNFYTAEQHIEVKGSPTDDGGDDDDGDGDGDSTINYTASLNASASDVEAGSEVTFNASTNFTAVEYEWDFDSDGTTDRTTEGSTTSEAFTTLGSRTVTVTASDSDGNTASATVTVEVIDTTAPTAALETPSSIVVNDTVAFNASASSDNSAIANYTWTVDNETETIRTTTTTEPVFRTAFDETGNYSVSVSPTDIAGNSNSTTANVTVEAATVESLDSSLTESTIDAGKQTSLTVTATLTNGTTRTVTDEATLSSGDSSIATILDNGTVTGESEGSVTLTADYEGENTSSELTVTPASVESIAVSLTENTIVAGSNTSLTVVATLSDGTTEGVTGAAALRSSNESVATVTDSGIVTGESAGTAVLSADYEGESDSTSLTVNAVEPPEITSIQVDEELTNDTVTVTATVERKTTDVETIELGVSAQFTEFRTTTPVEGTVTSGGTFTATVSADELVADGDYAGYAVVTDTRGNQVRDTNDSVSVDTSAPTLQPRVENLSSDPAMLSVEADEGFSITDLQINATADNGETQNRTPGSTPTGVQSAFTGIEFNGTQVGTNDTTFTIEITAEDGIGNRITETLNASITGYEINDNGTATVEPDSVDSAFVLNTNVSNTSGSAVVGQTDTPPANTSTAPNQIAGTFVDVSDIGVSNEDLNNATVRIPLSEAGIENSSQFDPSEFVLLRSADGESNYSSESVSNTRIETINGTEYVVGEVPGFSVFAVAVTDDTPPEVSDISTNPGTTPEPNQSVTTTFSYSDEISDIDVSATEISVTGPSSSRVDTQITETDATVTIESLDSGETIDLELTVTDTAGNEQTETETISVQAADDGDDSQPGGGGGFAPPSQETPETPDTSDDSETDTSDDSETDASDDSETDTGEEEIEDAQTSEDSVPGFGLVVTLVAVLSAALLAARRRP